MQSIDPSSISQTQSHAAENGNGSGSNINLSNQRLNKSKSSLDNINDIAEALGGANVSGLHLIGSSANNGPMTNWGITSFSLSFLFSS